MAEDSVDRLLQRIADSGARIDLDVEGIVDRIGHIHKRIHTALKETLVEYGLTPEDWHVMTSLGLRADGKTTSPGALARDLELSSGAMTSRLDRLEQLGYVHRLPDPDDRRGVRVELTDAGRKTWEGAIEVQGRKVKIGVQGGRIAAMNQMIPLGRGGLPEEAAGSVYLFCSPDSDYVSGQCLVVNGGL